jgi:trehalose 6-phosphate phosphatase
MERSTFPDTLPNPPAPPLPEGRPALFLDFDGTLIEIAARPDAVVVPPSLTPLLARLSAGLGGAVAIVTGRGLEVARSLSRSPPIAFAAEHGTIIDTSGIDAPEIPPMPLPPSPPQSWRDAAAVFVAQHPGLLLEEKRHGFVLHFRAVPELGAVATAFLEELVAQPGHGPFQVLPAHAAAELRPRTADKGSAVRWLMQHPPFAGRQPVFIGDDVTDEYGIAACRELGGTGYRIPRDFTGPAAVHAWLQRIADRMPA